MLLSVPCLFAFCSKEQADGGAISPDPIPEIIVEPEDDSSVYGLVSCDGKGVSGAVISDGVEVVRTDSKGIYQMKSLKKNGFVFISAPSGYEVALDGIVPQIKLPLYKTAAVAERVDFKLYASGGQTNHTMLFFGDIHLAGGRSNDRTQFRTFTSEIAKYIADHPGEKIYAITLGDMTWDLYWYSRSYGFAQYLADMTPLKGLPVFHTIGNHDHNMRTNVDGNASGWDAVDWDTGKAFRQSIAPSNYSFNIGKIHYVVLDDIYCRNTTGGESADRIYDNALSDEALAWLKKDLAFISKSTPVVVTMHSPVFDKHGEYNLKNSEELVRCFTGYVSATFVSGHSHKFWNIIKGNVREYNSGAVCAAWWDTGYYTPTLNIGQDGAPGGYRIMTVTGKTMKSRFKATGKPDDFQFRSYDRNSISLTPEAYGIKDAGNAAAFTEDMKKYGAYYSPSSENRVILNVWDKDDNWKIEVTENGRALDVTSVSYYDPLYLIAYVAKKYASGKSVSHLPSNTGHFYEITASSATSTLEIKVTDDEGRVYTESMKRPKPFSIDEYR